MLQKSKTQILGNPKVQRVILFISLAATTLAIIAPSTPGGGG